MFLKYTLLTKIKKKNSGIINLLSPVTFILFYIISHFLNTVCMSLSLQHMDKDTHFSEYIGAKGKYKG